MQKHENLVEKQKSSKEKKVRKRETQKESEIKEIYEKRRQLKDFFIIGKEYD